MNYNTQNEKIAGITEKTLVVGIDVGSETHYARAFNWRGYEFSKKAFAFSNTEAGFITFMEWIQDFQERYEKDAVIFGMEPTGHYWFNLEWFLQDNGLRPVLVNEGRFSYPYIPTGIYAEIRTVSNLRMQAQSELTRINNRIARWFSIYFPEYKHIYKKSDAVSGFMIIKHAPLPSDIRELGVDGVN